MRERDVLYTLHLASTILLACLNGDWVAILTVFKRSGSGSDCECFNAVSLKLLTLYSLSSRCIFMQFSCQIHFGNRRYWLYAKPMTTLPIRISVETNYKKNYLYLFGAQCAGCSYYEKIAASESIITKEAVHKWSVILNTLKEKKIVSLLFLQTQLLSFN